MDAFVKVADKEGMSRQASGVCKVAMDPSSPIADNKTALACALVAVRLGYNKPAQDMNDDQNTLANIRTRLNNVEQTAVEQRFIQLAAKAFEMNEQTLGQYLH